MQALKAWLRVDVRREAEGQRTVFSDNPLFWGARARAARKHGCPFQAIFHWFYYFCDAIHSATRPDSFSFCTLAFSPTAKKHGLFRHTMIEAWNSPLFTCDATSMSLPFPACFDTQSFALVLSVAAGSLRRLLLASQSPGLVTLPIWRKKKTLPFPD